MNDSIVHVLLVEDDERLAALTAEYLEEYERALEAVERTPAPPLPSPVGGAGR